MNGSRILLTGALATLLVVSAPAQYPRLVQDDWTGTMEVFLDQVEANQLQAELAQRVVDAGHDTVTQITLCGPDRESMEESSRYDRDMIAHARNMAQQAAQRSTLRDPIRDEDGRLTAYTYTMLFRAQDSSAPGTVTITYPHPARLEVSGDERDPSAFHFMATRDRRGRLIHASSTSREFDYDTKQWTESTTGWELSVAYDAAGHVTNVSHTSFKDDGVTLRSETSYLYNDHGFVEAIERYRDTDIRPCGSERAEAPSERMPNGLYLYRIDRFEYR